VAGVRPCTWPINVNITPWNCVLLSDQLHSREVHRGWMANNTTDVTHTDRNYVDSAELSNWCASVLVVMNRTSSEQLVHESLLLTPVLNMPKSTRFHNGVTVPDIVYTHRQQAQHYAS
jgi:hypothetical protein